MLGQRWEENEEAGDRAKRKRLFLGGSGPQRMVYLRRTMSLETPKCPAAFNVESLLRLGDFCGLKYAGVEE